MLYNSSLISPLPKITVQNRSYKVNQKITQMVRRLGKRRQLQILQERSQGFWMEDQVKLSLDRIKRCANKVKTSPLFVNPPKLISELDHRRHKTYNKNIRQGKKNTLKYYLPQLNQMIRSRESQSGNLIKEKRRKIIHLLVLCLNRRNLEKLYEALDIILLASFYFEKDDQQRTLKTICLSLISKLHHQIKNKNLTIKRKSKLIKRRKSLTVMNYHSRENFMQNFMSKFRKTKLVGQFSYADCKKHDMNFYKINAKCQVSIPKPQQIFGQSPAIKNYDFVAITVDDHTNMLPYQYPKSLVKKISPANYRQMICKINGLLFPQSKCYTLASILKIFYLPFMSIFMLLLSFSLLRTFVTNQIGRLLIICLTILCILILGIKISKQQSGYTNFIEIKDKMKEYLNAWQEEYAQHNLKFKMADNADAIFIVFPTQLPDPSQISSQLTSIQQVEQNYTQRNTSSKYNKTDKDIRRTGGRAEDNGNLMKIASVNKYSNNKNKFTKRENFVNIQFINYQKSIQTKEQRGISKQRIQNQEEHEKKILDDQIDSIRSQNLPQDIGNILIRTQSAYQQKNKKLGKQKQQNQKHSENSILKSRQNKNKNGIEKSNLKQPKTIKFNHDLVGNKEDVMSKIIIYNKKNPSNQNEQTSVNIKQQQQPKTIENQRNIQNKSITKKKQNKLQQQISETHLITPHSNHQNIKQKKHRDSQPSRFLTKTKNNQKNLH